MSEALSWAVPALLLLATGSGWGQEPQAPQRPLDGWHVTPKVLVLIHDPVVEARGGQKLHELMGWNDPDELARRYIEDLRRASGGMVEYEVAERVEVDGYPVKADGFVYTDDSYLAGWEQQAEWHQPDGVDYEAVLEEFEVYRKVEAGLVDEVWLFGAPYFGYYESLMVGQGGYWCNSEPLTDVDCERLFVVMGFNYERGVGEMLEDLGHRAESILWHVFGSWEPVETHAWNRFTLYDQIAPAKAACGNVHFAPNSESDYDWGNPRVVESTCEDWLYYPDLQGRRRQVSCDGWGGGDIEKHHVWWFDHFPRAPGETDGIANNWWRYVADLNGDRGGPRDEP